MEANRGMFSFHATDTPRHGTAKNLMIFRKIAMPYFW
jgi:hypothetical protein